MVVLAATNRLDDLDEAVIRRFEAKVYVGLPSASARLCMLRGHMQHVHTELSTQEFASVVELTADWSGSDIEVLCREAGERQPYLISFVYQGSSFLQRWAPCVSLLPTRPSCSNTACLRCRLATLQTRPAVPAAAPSLPARLLWLRPSTPLLRAKVWSLSCLTDI